MGKKKIIIAVVVLLLVAFAGYFFLVRGKSDAAGPPPKVEGVLLTMNPEFLLNLSDGHMAKFTITLLLEHKDHGAEAIVAASAGGHGAPVDPSKIPPHPQNALLRAIITDEVTATRSDEMLSRRGRKKLLDHIKKEFHHQTDAHVARVLMSDIVVD